MPSATLLRLFYTWFVLPTLVVGTYVSAIWNGKSRRRIREARRWHSVLKNSPPNIKVVWVHVASMGELEQALPVIERLKSKRSDVRVVVSVFSPSGIDHALRQDAIDCAFVMPWDFPTTMRKLVSMVNPSVVLFNRYDLWPNYVQSLSTSNVPMVLFNATKPSTSIPLVRRWWTWVYSQLNHVFAVSEDHTQAIRDLGVLHVSTLPDTRVDRMMDIVNHKPSEPLTNLKSPLPTLVLGSVWPADIQHFKAVYKHFTSLRLIIVPHELNERMIGILVRDFDATRYSQMSFDTSTNIIVDKLGLLRHIYRFGTMAFVGGGFGAGVHSITEPATYGIPVACGPNINRSEDAMGLHNAGVLTVVNDGSSLQKWLEAHLSANSDAVKSKAASYFENKSGSAEAVCNKTLELL